MYELKFMSRVLGLLIWWVWSMSLSSVLHAQSGLAVQGVLRDNQSRLMRSKTLNIRLGIFSTLNGTQPLYTEMHQTQTSPTGTYALSFGKGIALNGQFSAIPWASNPLFLETSIDTTNSNQWLVLSRQELLAVPTAHYAYLSERTKVRQVYLDSNTQILSPAQALGEQILNISNVNRTNVTLCPGLYYWNGQKWLKIADENGPCGNVQPFELFCNNLTISGSAFAGQAVNGVTIAIPYANGGGISIPSQTISSAGLSGLQAVLLPTQLNQDTGTLYLNVQGMSNGSGLAQFRLQVNLQTCFINLQVLSPGNTHQVQDVDGNLYDTLHIGNQVWLRENLRTTHYKNGDSIPIITQTTQWTTASVGNAGLYQNNPSFLNSFGLLYNYYAIVDSRGVCPIGYKVPSDSDWNQLLVLIGGSTTTAGAHLKKIGAGALPEWIYPNIDASNQFGFTAFPGGYRGINGTDYFAGFNGNWWSSTSLNSQTATSRMLQYNSSNLNTVGNNKSMGLSVRCLKE